MTDVNELAELVEQMRDQWEELDAELKKCDKNASAARRARKATSNMEKTFKEFRKISNEFHKKE